LGAGLYIADNSDPTGDCCGDFATIGVKSSITIEGADCSGDVTPYAADALKFKSGDFITTPSDCTATIEWGGFKVSGASGDSQISVENVKELRLSGITIDESGPLGGGDCEGNYIKISAEAGDNCLTSFTATASDYSSTDSLLSLTTNVGVGTGIVTGCWTEDETICIKGTDDGGDDIFIDSTFKAFLATTMTFEGDFSDLDDAFSVIISHGICAGGGGAICPDCIDDIGSANYSYSDSLLTIDMPAAFSASVLGGSFNADCWVSGDMVSVSSTNSDDKVFHAPATIATYNAPNMTFIGDFSEAGGDSLAKYAPGNSNISLCHGPCGLSANAIEQEITLCVDGKTHSGNILFNPS
jgi:hypothetical protein